MEFYEVINKRRSIRQLEEREIPDEVLERILEKPHLPTIKGVGSW